MPEAMRQDTLQAERDGAWEALSGAPLRRAMLGRVRCDRLVRLAAEALDSAEFRGAVFDNAHGRAARRQIARRVGDVYSEPCSSVFVSLVLSWAIQAIVSYLIRRWWESRR